MKDLKIGIILSTTRPERVSEDIGNWVLEKSKQFSEATYNIVDLKDYKMPFYGEEGDMDAVTRFNRDMGRLDGYLFVLAEYNHSLPGVLKNAIDWTNVALHNKSAGIISYGAVGGARAAEHLRGILGAMKVADVQTHILLNLFDDFENMNTFKPRDLHDKNLKSIFEQVESWAKQLKPLRD